MAYLLPLRLDKRIYVGTTVWFFFASNYAKIVPYAFLGQLDTTNFATSLVLLPLVPVGVKLGVLIQGKLEERVFYQISYWAMLTMINRLDGQRNSCSSTVLAFVAEPPARNSSLATALNQFTVIRSGSLLEQTKPQSLIPCESGTRQGGAG